MSPLAGLGRYRRGFCALIWGAALVLAAGTAVADWLQKEEGGYRTYYWNTFLNPKFQYNLSTFQWSHYSSIGSSWYAISATGRPETFIGDGSSHSLGNGFNYTYLTASDSGWFLKGSAGRFNYLYTPGQWTNYSSFGGWQNLGKAGLSASFMGDGSSHSLGNGFNYTYLTASDSGWFLKASAGRFNYLYTPGQWKSYSSHGGWQILGKAGLSASFMGDGSSHSLGNGFNYTYLTASDSGWFLKGSAGRFNYLYVPGQWKSYSSHGGWQILGKAGLSASFMGDGSSHSLGNGFNYTYLTASDSGWFLRGSAGRFNYLYTPGQWRHYSIYDGWQNLGNAVLSASFMGDGASHALGNGFNYTYLTATDSGWFLRGSAGRFNYLYTPGQWRHYSIYDGWQNLGTGLSASFVGDGAYHFFGEAFWLYAYNVSSDIGMWSVTNGESYYARYTYVYSLGQWWHQGRTASGWFNLGAGGRSARFLADGDYHDLGDGWWYRGYLVCGWWSTEDASYGDRYWYYYDAGQWLHQGAVTAGYSNLGSAGRNASFVGDGAYHDLGNGWFYRGVLASNRGFWSTDCTTAGDRYLYQYDDSQWQHRGVTGGYYDLGWDMLDASFIADGYYHDLQMNFSDSWWYAGGLNMGHWSTDGTTAGERYRYNYTTGQWENKGVTGGFFNLGVAGRSASFMGYDAAFPYLFHDLGNGYWYTEHNFMYYAYWSTDGTWEGVRYGYDYSTGQWDHSNYGGSLWAIGHEGMSAWFLGDGLEHDLFNQYSYHLEDNVGYWHTSGGGGDYRYYYVSGEWWWNDPLWGWKKIYGPNAETYLVNPGET